MEKKLNEVIGSEVALNSGLNNEDYQIAINVIKEFENDKYSNTSADHKEMNLIQLEEEAKAILNKVVSVDKVEMKKKIETEYLRLVCEEEYGDEDPSDPSEQEDGYFATALWNNREGIEKRLFEVLFDETHIQYYKKAVKHYCLEEQIDDTYKSVIASAINRYDR